MAIVMKIFIEQDATGVATRIESEGPCTRIESEQAEFIYKSVIAALESRNGFKRNEPDICQIKEINNSTTEGNENVH